MLHGMTVDEFLAWCDYADYLNALVFLTRNWRR